MKDAFIVDILRTPIGKYGGVLSSVRPDDLAAFVIRSLLDRNKNLDTSLIEDVVFGAANQAGEDNRNVARMAALLAGLPVKVAGVTVNRLCASGLEAIAHCFHAVRADHGRLFIAGGSESMSRAPFVMAKSENAFSRKAELFDTTMGWRFTNPALSNLYHPYSMGETAEIVAERYKISRDAQDEFALQSQERYFAAEAEGKWKSERVPFELSSGGNVATITTDEHPRTTSLEKLKGLKPSFKSGGSVTAGNSSGINDGAAACVVVDESLIKLLKLRPLARIVSSAVVGVDPSEMGIGPVPATQKALERAGLKLNDIDLIELNEAFASQALACMNELRLDPSRVNVNGGAIALGHPLGCSGVRISATLLHEMQRRRVKYGLATMCVGVGQGAAIIYERA